MEMNDHRRLELLLQAVEQRLNLKLKEIQMTLDELNGVATTTVTAIEAAVVILKSTQTDPAKVQAIGDALAKATADLNAVIAPTPAVPPTS